MKTHAERLAEIEAEDMEEQQPGLTLKFKHDGDQVKSSASWPKHDPALVVDMPERMGTCGEEFEKNKSKIISLDDVIRMNKESWKEERRMMREEIIADMMKEKLINIQL